MTPNPWLDLTDSEPLAQRPRSKLGVLDTLQCIIDHGPISESEIARRTGHHRTTVNLHVQALGAKRIAHALPAEPGRGAAGPRLWVPHPALRKTPL